MDFHTGCHGILVYTDTVQRQGYSIECCYGYRYSSDYSFYPRYLESMVVYSLILEVQSDTDKLFSMMSLPVSLKNTDPILEILTRHQPSDTMAHISVLHLCGQMLGSLEGAQTLKFYWYLHISCFCLLCMVCGNHFLAFSCPF